MYLFKRGIYMNKLKHILSWTLTVFSLIFSIVAFFSVSSIDFLIIAALIVPITKWQNIIKKYIGPKFKIIIIVILTILAFAVYPSSGDETPNITPTNIPIITNTSTPTPTVKPTVTPTPTPTVKPTVTPTPTPTVKPTAAPTPTPHIHNLVDATCTQPKKCTSCDYTEGDVLEHNYNKGYCTMCGRRDPNYINDEMVWIPTNGGSKYHSNSTCSNMKSPIQVTKDYAISQNYEACKRCH